MRKSDGRCLTLGGNIYLSASSGLTGEPGGSKSLRLLFHADEEPQPRRRGGSGGRVESAAPRLGQTSVALTFAVPKAAALTNEVARTNDGEVGYGMPFLASVELLALPIQRYWDIEDWMHLRPPCWELVVTDHLQKAIATCGAPTLTEAWTHDGVTPV